MPRLKVRMPVGRPPMGERAMTPAEKQRRYRERKFGNKPKRPPVTKLDQGTVDATAVFWIDRLEAENAALKAALDRAKAAIKAGLEAIQQLKAENAALKAEQAEARAAPSDARVAELEAEL